MRQLALACLDFLDLPAADFVRIAADAGFEAVTLRVAGSLAPVPGDLSHDPVGLRAARHALRDTGLVVLDAEVVRLTSRSTDAELTAAVELAAQCGARFLLVVVDDPDHASVAERLAWLVERSAVAGIRPCVEFMAFCFCRTLAEAAALATATGAGVLVDALHLHRSGATAADVKALVDRHGPQLFPYLQLCDASDRVAHATRAQLRAEALSMRLLPGDGVLPLQPLLTALPEVPVSVEAPTIAHAHLPALERARAARRAALDAVTLELGMTRR